MFEKGLSKAKICPVDENESIDGNNDVNGNKEDASSDVNGREEEDNVVTEVGDQTKRYDDVIKSINNDIAALYNETTCKDANNLLTYNAKDWLSERPETLVDILVKLTDLDPNNNRNSIQLVTC